MTTFVRAWWLSAAIALALTFGLCAGQAETRLALVIGNDQYRAVTLPTPANDAGLVADALQGAGFTVTGARNLGQAELRDSFREFLDQVSAAGPDAVALIYLSGLGLQFNGDNYFVPVDADVRRDVDIPLQSIRVSDFTQPLASLPGRVKIVVLDATRKSPFAAGDQQLAGGLALVAPVPGMAIAFSAAPGTIGPDEPGPYGAYASALAEMIGAGGLGLDDIFARVRLRVAEQTQGGQIPWFVSQLNVPFYMTERDASAPPPPNVLAYADIRSKPLRDFGNVEDAYAAALELDTFEGYEQFLAAYPTSSYARRIAAMLAVRREEIIWRRCIADDTPQAYWSYLRRYPNGPHVWDARRRLAILRAELAPPPSFAFVDFGVPPPPPDELIVVDRPVVLFFAPGLPPPPRPPIFFLPPRPREFVALAAPPPPRERFGLPVPRIAVVPASVKPPANVRPPAGQPGAPPGGGQRVPISLPGAVAHPGAPRASGPPSGQHLPPAGQPIVPPPHQGGPPQPPAASLKPAPIPPHALPPPPPHGAPPPPLAPAAVKPAPPPPHPVPPPPPHAAPPPHPAPAAVKPPPPPHPAPPPPPHPALPPPHPAPAAAKPPPPPPHPAPPPPPPPAAAKPPACPAGKHPTPEGCK